MECSNKNKGYKLSYILNDASFESIGIRFNFASQDEMFCALGVGAITSNQILIKLIDIYKKQQQALKPQEKSENFAIRKTATEEVSVEGHKGMLVRFAGCCNPVPGDKIIGFVSKGRGVTVHRANCPNMKNEDSQRFVSVEWTGKGGSGFFTSLKVTMDERASLLGVISGYCSQLNLFISAINGRIDNKLHVGIIEFTVKINNSDDVDLLIKKIKSEKGVIDVFRTVN